MKFRILLVDDHHLFLHGLHALLEQHGEFTVMGTATNGREAIQLVENQPPDLVIMDASMPGMNGIEATRQIRKNHPMVKVLIVSMHKDRRFVLAALEAGAAGYMLKDGAWDIFLQAIHAVQSNQIYLCPGVAGFVTEAYLHPRKSQEAHTRSPLTAREREIVQLLAEGQSMEHIAGILNVSVKTVHSHRTHLMKKLQISSLAALTKYAIREGLTKLEA